MNIDFSTVIHNSNTCAFAADVSDYARHCGGWRSDDR